MRPSRDCINPTDFRAAPNLWTTNGRADCQGVDWLLFTEDLGGADHIRALCINHLLTERRSLDTDPYPPSGDRRGWWADSHRNDGFALGSRLWTLIRKPTISETLRTAEEMAIEALGWLKAAGVISEAIPTATYRHGDHLRLDIEVRSPSGRIDISLAGASTGFGYLWSEER